MYKGLNFLADYVRVNSGYTIKVKISAAGKCALVVELLTFLFPVCTFFPE